MIITRAHYSDKQVIGFGECNGLTFATLELPWKQNEKRVSCIPHGKYKCVKRTSQKYGVHWHITNVPNRSLILIHSGNFHTDILGCVLVGERHSDINGDGHVDVVSSAVTMNKLRAVLPDEFELEIIS
jgi:hypothetical protein